MATVIARPTIGGVPMPFPSSTTIEPVWLYGETLTLGGTTRRDIMARKYRYVLSWTHISVTDYNAIEAVVNNLTFITFIYDKWPQSASPGVSCLCTLSARSLEYGVGNEDYLSSATLTLIEVSTRLT